MAYVQGQDSKSLNDIIEFIAEGSTITKAESMANIEKFFSGVEYLVGQGHRVNTPLFNISLSIAGAFTNKEDTFTIGRHQGRIRVQTGVRLKDLERSLAFEKVKGDRPMPSPEDYVDVNSSTRNDVVTSGGIGQLTGSRLKFDASDSNQGIFFIASDGSATQVAPIVRNKPADINFLVPTLAPGNYKVEVRSVISDGKEIRVGTLAYMLSVI